MGRTDCPDSVPQVLHDLFAAALFRSNTRHKLALRSTPDPLEVPFLARLGPKLRAGPVAGGGPRCPNGNLCLAHGLTSRFQLGKRRRAVSGECRPASQLGLNSA